MSIGDTERATQDRVVSFFKDRDILDYEYVGNLKDAANKNIREDRLRAYLRLSGYSQKLIDGAVSELVKAADDMTHGLYDANHKVYSLLKYGAKVKETADGAPKTVYFMDVETPTNNDFAIAEEVTVVGRQEKRPDLVIYVNGIAMAVIELKKSSVSVSNGIRQNLTNQKDGFIAPFFTTMQFCMAGNEIEGLRYGTIQTKEKYYMEWKPDGFHENEDERDPEDARIMAYCEKLDTLLLQQIYQMFDKKRFIDLIENFVVYDKGIKKVCRYNQFYGIKRTQRRLAKQRGGIIWHTQGSGKTLTMVWLSKWILANCEEENPRVLIVTDRDELDEQIEKTYIGVDEKITRTKSCDDLLQKLNSYDDSLLCSLVHKFGRRGGEATESDYDKYIDELKKALPADFKAKGKIFVFVDECHRTQSGKLHAAMQAIMPEAIFIGFTGTPLLKKDKKTSIEVFGTYIHSYKYNEAVKDGVVLDLRYEYRDIPQDITAHDRIDQWFDVKTRTLSSRASSLVRAYAEAKQYMVDICSATELNAYENKVHFYIELKQTIGNKSGDFLDFKAYEPDMRKLIDNYIMASDSIKIGEFDDLTLLDFVMDQGETMTGEDTPSGQKEGAAEAIENNIRRKMVEKVTVNPKYYEKMSAILDKLIQDRQKGVLSYKELLDEYIKLAKNVDHPEENEDYPESVRHSKAMQALYDNVGGDEVLAIELHKAVMDSKMCGFRGDSIKERRIKRALFAILNDDTEVERLYKIIEKQEEY